MAKRSSRKKEFCEPTLPSDLLQVLKEKINALSPSIKADYLKAEIFSKYVSDETDSPELRASRAESKWLAQEAFNEETEVKLMFTPVDFQVLQGVDYQVFVDKCCEIIAQIIGDSPPEEAVIGAFSGGASTSRPRTQAQPSLKFVGKAHTTDAARDMVVDLIHDLIPAWSSADASSLNNLEDVAGNVLFTVPKKTDIDRVAAKEPDLNMFVQKGIGDYFRSRLRRAGIDLNDQTKNQSLACRGSEDGSLATLDLSSASDSVTTELVFQLLPITWFTLLDSVRSPVTILRNGEEHRNSMFSSMGNGFTFELESLIFYALMRTTAYFTGTRGVVSVYGDDIIIPTQMADKAIWILSYFGFKVNPEKTHTSGLFRESCGGHYYGGYDITPFYIKKPIRKMVDVIHVANQLRKWGDPKYESPVLCRIIDPEVEAIWKWLKGFIPSMFWGGADLSFKYQLVSDDRPVARLSEVSKPRKAYGLGGYLHWLNATWARKVVNEAVVTSRYTTPFEDPIFEVRPCMDKTVPRLGAYFYHELGIVTGEEDPI